MWWTTWGGGCVEGSCWMCWPGKEEVSVEWEGHEGRLLDGRMRCAGLRKEECLCR